eukprot:664492-Pelagomonas_calceolata.AAC.2
MQDYLDLLNAAANESDPVDRMKYVVAFALSGLCRQVSFHKPFNPILGETYQVGGDQVYGSHSSSVSHGGCLSTFFYAHYEAWKQKVRTLVFGNIPSKVRKQGRSSVKYLYGSLPQLRASGICQKLINPRSISFTVRSVLRTLILRHKKDSKYDLRDT